VACSHAPAPAPSPTPPSTRASYDLPGDGNGALWDERERALYITDDTHGQLVRWTDARGFEPVATVASSDKLALGGIVRLDDGRFVVASFGFGKSGGAFVIAGATATAVPDMEPTRRRIGMARTPDGTIYDAYFVVGADKQHVGGVARLDPSGREEPLAVTGLEKPVGIAATATTLYIADQLRRTIVSYDLATTATAPFASDLPAVDLLAVLPGGDLVTGGKRGEVYRIDARGHATTLASGFEQVRGVAYDPAGARLFVVEHGANGRHRLHALPLAP
jgi:sugar lactone lactonase YvrE